MTDCTIVIPTRNRHRLVRDAVASALAQTAEDTRVLVVDDASDPAVTLPKDLRLSVVRHLRPRGVSAARNLGAALATTPFVTFLDDDDRLRPRMVELSLQALAVTHATPPVATLSGLALVDEEGRITDIRLPPSLRPRGDHYSLEPIEPGRSHFCMQTLVVPRDVLLAIGGFDERFRSRVVTDLFWRLNPVCSIIGLDDVTYEQRSHPGARLSTNRRLRRRSFRRLILTHRDLLHAHPDGYADLVAQHARMALQSGLPVEAFAAAMRHAWIAPGRTVQGIRRVAASRLRR